MQITFNIIRLSVSCFLYLLVLAFDTRPVLAALEDCISPLWLAVSGTYYSLWLVSSLFLLSLVFLVCPQDLCYLFLAFTTTHPQPCREKENSNTRMTRMTRPRFRSAREKKGPPRSNLYVWWERSGRENHSILLLCLKPWRSCGILHLEWRVEKSNPIYSRSSSLIEGTWIECYPGSHGLSTNISWSCWKLDQICNPQPWRWIVYHFGWECMIFPSLEWKKKFCHRLEVDLGMFWRSIMLLSMVWVEVFVSKFCSTLVKLFGEELISVSTKLLLFGYLSSMKDCHLSVMNVDGWVILWWNVIPAIIVEGLACQTSKGGGGCWISFVSRLTKEIMVL